MESPADIIAGLVTRFKTFDAAVEAFWRNRPAPGRALTSSEEQALIPPPDLNSTVELELVATEVQRMVMEPGSVEVKETLGSGVIGVVFRAFVGERFYVAAKEAEHESTAPSIIHEVYIGRRWLNSLWSQIPNFMYVYGMAFRDPHVVGLFELLKGVTFDRIAGSLDAGEIQLCVLQVALALQMAYEHCRFSHHDLHLGNVMCRPVSREIRYVTGFGTFRLAVNHVLTIFDFGGASAEGEEGRSGDEEPFILLDMFSFVRNLCLLTPLGEEYLRFFIPPGVSSEKYRGWMALQAYPRTPELMALDLSGFILRFGQPWMEAPPQKGQATP